AQSGQTPTPRVDSFTFDFLEADYPNLYGIPDIRKGGDNLDVLPMFFFEGTRQLCFRDPKVGLSKALAVEGLADVGSFIDAPGSKHDSPDLEPLYSGPDMEVWRNKRALPRAAFFADSALIPFNDPLDWNEGRRTAGQLAGLVAQPQFD